MDGMLESGKPGLDGMKYRVAMQLVQNGGESSVSPENGIRLKNGQEAWLILSAATSYAAAGTDFPGERYAEVCDSLLRPFTAPANSPCSILHSSFSSHVTAHRFLYDRVSLTLPATPDDTLPTNERILRFTQQESPALAALYYNYGRYLLISSTRPGSLAAQSARTLDKWSIDSLERGLPYEHQYPDEPLALGASRPFRTLSAVDNVDGAPCPFGRSKCAYFLWR